MIIRFKKSLWTPKRSVVFFKDKFTMYVEFYWYPGTFKTKDFQMFTESCK